MAKQARSAKKAKHAPKPVTDKAIRDAYAACGVKAQVARQLGVSDHRVRRVVGKGTKRDSPAVPTEDAVWATYEQKRSIRRTAAALGCTAWYVETVLEKDKARQQSIHYHEHEHNAALWEEATAGSLKQALEAMRQINGVIAEIDAAVAENRMTRILSPEGAPLPVFDAARLLEHAKLLGSRIHAATQAQQMASAFRANGLGGAADVGSGRRDPSAMSDAELAAEARELGIAVFPLHKAADRAKQLQEEARAEHKKTGAED